MPLGGIWSSDPADVLDPKYTPRCANVHFRFGDVRAKPGNDNLGNLGDAIRWTGNFYTVGGLNWVLAFTASSMHRRGNTLPGSPQQWYAISGATAITAADRFSTTAGEGYFFFTYGDYVYRWDGVGVNAYAHVPVAEGAGIFENDKPYAKFVEYFNNRTVLGYTEEAGGTIRTNRIRWPEALDHTKWDDTLGEGAGFLDLYEEGEEPITNMKGLQDKLVVYKRRAIVDMIPTGVLDPVHILQTRSRGIGCGAPWTLASNGMMHFFMSFDRNVYTWDGIRLVPIGNPIVEELRALTAVENLENYFGVISAVRDEYWLVIDDDNVFVYDWRRQSWTRDTFPDITALGSVEETRASITWNVVTETWDEMTERWSHLEGASIDTLFAGNSSGDIFQVDEQFVYDYFSEGSITDKYVETPDFYFPGDRGEPDPWVQGTIKQVFVMYEYVNSNPVEVGLSFDRGRTWYTQEFTPTEAGYSQVSFNRTGNVVRFRFRQRDVHGQPRWRQFAYEFVPHGPYRPT
jgi:hypothetical protein